MDGTEIDGKIVLTKPKRRPGNPAWVKGVSGNPGGRVAESKEIVALCRQHSPEAIMRLVDHIRSKGPTSVRACEAILNRAYGLPPQAIKLMGDDAAPLVMEVRSAAEQFHHRILSLMVR